MTTRTDTDCNEHVRAPQAYPISEAVVGPPIRRARIAQPNRWSVEQSALMIGWSQWWDHAWLHTEQHTMLHGIHIVLSRFICFIILRVAVPRIAHMISVTKVLGALGPRRLPMFRCQIGPRFVPATSAHGRTSK